MHPNSAWVAIILTVFSVLLLPALALLFRGAIKWTRTEDKLATLVEQVEKLVDDKDKVHAAMLDQMRADRDSTDRKFERFEQIFMQLGVERIRDAIRSTQSQ